MILPKPIYGEVIESDIIIKDSLFIVPPKPVRGAVSEGDITVERIVMFVPKDKNDTIINPATFFDSPIDLND